MKKNARKTVDRHSHLRAHPWPARYDASHWEPDTGRGEEL